MILLLVSPARGAMRQNRRKRWLMNYEMPAVLITQQLHGSMEYLLDTNVCINIFRDMGYT